MAVDQAVKLDQTSHLVTQLLAYTPEQVQQVRDAYDALDDDTAQNIEDAGILIEEALDDVRHPALQLTCGSVDTDLRPRIEQVIDLFATPCPDGFGRWTYGVEEAINAVAARELGVVDPADFETATGWWVATGLPLLGQA